jgi:hypothetical protein
LARNAADAGTESAGATVTSGTLRDEIHKRLTLNWLIQGASQHAGMTLHHLVRDELDAIDPKLIRLYDQFALIGLLQYWSFEFVLRVGWPRRFWRRAATNPKHPFFGHALLSRHGGMLAAEARRRAIDRCREKGLSSLPGVFIFQAVGVINEIQMKEAAHTRELIELAKKAAALVWGIPTERFNADLCGRVAFGNLRRPRTFCGRLQRLCVIGYSGVMPRNGELVVVAKAKFWQVLAKELVKGTAELICLHGLNSLSDDLYQRVLDYTDRIEFETWMLQSGGELWRRFLAVLPEGRPVATMLMHVARLPAKSLESLMLDVIEQPQRARDALAELAGPDPDGP